MIKYFVLYLLLCSFKTGEVTIKEVKEEIINQGIRHSDVVIKQAILEVGWINKTHFKSEIHNNLFGFIFKGKEIQFNHWKESITYYKKWQDKHYPGRINYYDWLKCMWYQNGKCISYANDPEYIDKLKSILYNLNSK